MMATFFFLLESCLLLFRCHILSIATTKQNREGFVGIFINFTQGFNSLDQASFLLKTHHFVYIACISHKQGHRIRNYLSQIIHLGVAPNSVFFLGGCVCVWLGGVFLLPRIDKNLVHVAMSLG